MVFVIKGDFDEYTNSTPVSLTAGSSHYKTDIDTKGALEVTVLVFNGTLQENGSITGGDSTSVDVLVYGNLGSGYATVASGLMNLVDNSSDILYVNPSSYKMKLEIKNTGSVTTVVNYKVVVKR